MAKPMSKKRAKLFPPICKRSAGSILCVICGRVLAGRVGYVTHHDITHPRQKPQWKYTKQKPDNPRLLPHQFWPKYNYHCNLCGYGGKVSTTAFYNHFKRHHPCLSPRQHMTKELRDD